MIKVLVALFIGLLVVNANRQTQILKDDSAKSVVIEWLHQLVQEAGDFYDLVNQTVEGFDSNQDQIEDSIVAALVNLGDALNSAFLQEINSFRANATADGIAVINCVDAEKDTTEFKFQEVFTDVGNCIAAEFPKINSEFRIILEQIADIQYDLVWETNTLVSCTDIEESCLLIFVSNFVETLQKIPAFAQQDMQDIKDLAQEISTNIKVCFGTIDPEIKQSVQQIFNEVVVCVYS